MQGWKSNDYGCNLAHVRIGVKLPDMNVAVLVVVIRITNLAIIIRRSPLHYYHPSVLLHCWLGHLTCKIVFEMTYNMSSETLNPTIPYNAIFLHYVYTALLFRIQNARKCITLCNKITRLCIQYRQLVPVLPVGWGTGILLVPIIVYGHPNSSSNPKPTKRC